MITNYLRFRKFFIDSSNELIIIRIFIAFATATLTVIPSLYLSHLGMTNSQIGFILGFTLFLSLIISLLSTIILEKFNEYKIFRFSIIIPLIFLVFVMFFQDINSYILFLIIFGIFGSFRTNSFAIIFKDSTKKTEYSQKEGLMYSLQNVGWFIGPILAGLVLENYSFFETFLLAFMFLMLSLVISLFVKINIKNKKRKTIDSNIFKNIKYYIKNKDLRKAYLITFGSDIWYALIFTFMPLFIIQEGLSVFWVGLFIAFNQFPLIIIQFRLGYFINKFGSKNILIYSYYYLILSALLCFIFPNIYFVLILLVLSAFAMGFIEPLREIYFFKYVKEIDEERTYPIYNTSFSMGSIFGRIILSWVLLLFSYEYTYLIIALIMGYFVYVSYTLKNFDE